MLDKLRKPALAGLLLYSALILVVYGDSYLEIPTLSEFSIFSFLVIGGRLLFVLVLALSAYGYAGLIPRRWAAVFDSSLEEVLVRIALGLMVISYMMYAVGLAGILYVPVGLAVLTGGILIGSRDLVVLVRRVAPLPRTVRLGFLNVLLISVSAYFLVRGLYYAMLPPTGFDVLMYHIGVPRIYLDAHRIIPTPDINGSAFPFGIEMLYMLGMINAGVISANIVNYSFAVMGGLAAALFARRYVQGSSGLVAFTIYVCIPMVFFLMPQAYIELAQAAYGMLAIYAVARWSSGKQKGWLIAAAALTGFSMSIKYTGMLVVGIMTLLILTDIAVGERSGIKKALAVSAAFLGIALLVSAPWHVKNVIIYGNPGPISRIW